MVVSFGQCPLGAKPGGPKVICCIYLSTNRGYKANSRLFTIERLPGISAGEGTEDFPPQTP